MIGSVEQIYKSEQKQTVTRIGGGGNSTLSRPILRGRGNIKLCGMKWRVKCDFPKIFGANLFSYMGYYLGTRFFVLLYYGLGTEDIHTIQL